MSYMADIFADKKVNRPILYDMKKVKKHDEEDKKHVNPIIKRLNS